LHIVAPKISRIRIKISDKSAKQVLFLYVSENNFLFDNYSCQLTNFSLLAITHMPWQLDLQ